ncbi:hypothetical protein ACE418_03045 [Megasphaera sp. WILCCON 0056]|uniref:hypothetical protein n=1 Tax=Megasphaera sp. WILCCON 0056 TaxID=3345340 RepID=UPI003A7FA2A9
MTAEEARKIATQKRLEEIEAINPSYQACIEDINWAARQGDYSVIFHGELQSQDKKSLKEKGFKLSRYTILLHDYCCKDVYYKISWEKQYTLCERIKKLLSFI